MTITNSSYYQSAGSCGHSGGVGILYTYRKCIQHTNATYQLELSYSNMTKCCSDLYGGGIHLKTLFAVSVLFSHLVLSHNRAYLGGGLEVYAKNLTLVVTNCIFSHGFAENDGGALFFLVKDKSTITVQDTLLLENSAPLTSELQVTCGNKDVSFFLLNSSIKHTKGDSKYGVLKISQCKNVFVTDSRMQVSNQSYGGFSFEAVSFLKISNSLFKESINVFSVLLISQSLHSQLRNCSFSNNSGHSAVMLHHSRCFIYDSTISANMNTTGTLTAITIIQSLLFEVHGRTVIQNNMILRGRLESQIVLPGKIALWAH